VGQRPNGDGTTFRVQDGLCGLTQGGSASPQPFRFNPGLDYETPFGVTDWTRLDWGRPLCRRRQADPVRGDQLYGGFFTLSLPVLGAQLAWDTWKLAVDGSLSVVTVTPPQITAFTRVGYSTFKFTPATNSVAASYTLQVSTNLVTWEPLQSALPS